MRLLIGHLVDVPVSTTTANGKNAEFEMQTTNGQHSLSLLQCDSFSAIDDPNVISDIRFINNNIGMSNAWVSRCERLHEKGQSADHIYISATACSVSAHIGHSCDECLVEQFF